MKRYCLAIDLVDDPESIMEYEQHHANVWPEVEKNMRDSGILLMEIYRVEARLFMIMEVKEDFSFEKKKAMEEKNPTVQEWEKLMSTYQKVIQGGLSGEKWRLMTKIYDLNYKD